jgi:hypothetical protein
MPLRYFVRNNGLSIALVGCFAASQVGLSLAGQRQYNAERTEHGQPTVSYREYVASAHFAEATMENWESEFLQMWAFVMLTAILYQKGSAESKDPNGHEAVDRPPRSHHGAPKSVKKGGWRLAIFERSLGLALLSLFAVSFWLHAWSGARLHTEDQLAHGGEAITTWEYLGTSQFWFESFQNWQSEFFSIAVLVILTIFLRQRGSSQSKPVDAAHSETGVP